MDDKHLDELLKTLREGSKDDKEEQIRLIVARLTDGDGAPVDLLVTLLAAPETNVRVAAVKASRGRTEPAVIAALEKLVDDEDKDIRMVLTTTLGSLRGTEPETALALLLEDDDGEVRKLAARAVRGRESMLDTIVARLESDDNWEVRTALTESLKPLPRNVAMPIAVRVMSRDDDDDVQRVCAEILEKHFSAGGWPDEVSAPDPTVLSKAQRALGEIGADRYGRLKEWLKNETRSAINLEEIGKFGTDLTTRAERGQLPRAYGVDAICDRIEESLLGDKPRSLVLLGESGCGKSAVVCELVHRLKSSERGGWRVLRISPSEFLAGTIYLGEWQTKLRNLVQAVGRPRPVLVYIPNIEELSTAGKSANSDANLATALAPHIEDGSVLLLGESNEKSYEAGLGGEASLRRLFDTISIPNATPEETRSILTSVRDEFSAAIDDTVLDQISELASDYLCNVARPGNAVGLLRRTIADQPEQTITVRHVLGALSASTGLPVDLLDDEVPLNLAEVRHFFESRVMGQGPAIDAVVDLVTLIKAGLTDPNKPFGVFLFVGPTGVGKTELTRALAEYIFGDAARLTRLDMSEYAGYGGFERLIGTTGQSGTLTRAVKRAPFSVLLFDEIEKAHVNVFDIFLQLFDAGRLTDGRGTTVDFRSTIIVMTSNVGTPSPGEKPVGFGAQPPKAVDRERTFRELASCFRPEFLNRIDRIINFHPLSLDVAEQIARREVGQVLQRSGITRRDISIDVEPEVLTLLVREGYSPHFGARPLKRAVERLILLPVGRTIATGRIPDRAVLRLRRQGDRVLVDIEKIDSDPVEVTEKQPAGVAALRARVAVLSTDVESLISGTQELGQRKQELLDMSREPGFWNDSDRSRRTFDEIHRLDELLTSVHGLGKAVEGFRARVDDRPIDDKDMGKLEDRLEHLTTEFEQLSNIRNCSDPDELGDAIICLSLIDQQGEGLDGIRRMVRMYEGLARRRHFTGEVMAESFPDGAGAGSVYLLVSGIGAYGLLRGEQGLHQLVHRYQTHAHRSGRERHGQHRDMVRVEVFPSSSEPLPDVKVRAHDADAGTSRFFEKQVMAVRVFHEPSVLALHVLTQGPRADAIETARRLLAARLDRAETEPDAAAPVVRRYDLGSSPGVKDLRSGRTTPLVDRVLRGHLDPFLRFE